MRAAEDLRLRPRGHWDRPPNRVLQVFIVRTAKYCASQRSLPIQFCAILQISVALNVAVYELMYCGHEQTEVSKLSLIILLFASVCAFVFDCTVLK